MSIKKTTISDVAEINPRLRKEAKPQPDKIISFVPMASVSELSMTIENPIDRPYHEVQKGFTAFQRGDILVAKITPCFENGKMAYANNLPHDLGFGSTEFHVLRPREKLFGKYLFHLLREPFVRQAGEIKMKGAAGQRRVPANFFADLKIPLPPLAEQKRIAGILDAADALRAKRREAISQLDALLQSTFLTLFGDPVSNPMGWEVKKSSDLFLVTPRIGTATPAKGKGYLVVRVGEIGQSKIAFERCGRVEISQEDFKKFQLQPGDIVIARAIGSKNQLGKASFFTGFHEEVVADSHVMRLRPDPTKCDSCWFYSLISSDRGKILLQKAGGATAVQFNINGKQASSLNIPLPPLELQHHFTTIFKSIEKQKAQQRAHLAELDTLFASLQSRAFKGEL
ncbi:restriction endonuclease S subunit [Leptolyngbya sp. PCC 7375]|nr:restriction endonuclease S subunit [Leptolyngbya sp. PCC 7375]